MFSTDTEPGKDEVMRCCFSQSERIQIYQNCTFGFKHAWAVSWVSILSEDMTSNCYVRLAELKRLRYLSAIWSPSLVNLKPHGGFVTMTVGCWDGVHSAQEVLENSISSATPAAFASLSSIAALHKAGYQTSTKLSWNGSMITLAIFKSFTLEQKLEDS